jgi:type II secretion system protein N
VNPRVLRIARYVGYPLFYLFALLVFVGLTFPFERLKNRIVSEFNARPSAERPLRLEIDELSGYWLTGLEAEGVRLVSPPPPEEDAKTAKPKIVTLDEVHVRASVLRLLVGIVRASFGGKAFGGEVSGYLSDGGDARALFLELENVSVADLPLLGDAVGLPLVGTSSGTADLEMPEQKLARAKGKIELVISGLSVGDGKAKIRDTIALPKLDAGELVFQAEAEEGRLKIEKLSANGPDLELSADGRIRLRDPFESSLVELSLRFKFTDKYKNKNDMTRGLFGAPGTTIPGIFDLDPKNRRAKRTDGSYGWRITGPISHLSFEPAPTASSPAGGAAPPPVRGFSPRAP